MNISGFFLHKKKEQFFSKMITIDVFPNVFFLPKAASAAFFIPCNSL